ncbi:MAG: UvrD-helicase domain-containing protein [Phycisphaeraceae bacterium]|nr:UvrD-helicase domain-containing protein [Phycisphaeraceae bacterium]
MMQVWEWLRAQMDTLDKAVADACQMEVQAHPEWDGFEYLQTLEDTLRLSDRRSMDCYYDRPSIGFAYASWYHGRRTQQIVRAIASWLDEPGLQHLSIIDLGCGTGATLWSIGLLVHFRHAYGLPCPHLRVWSVDSSPFLLRFAERAWRRCLLPRYPQANSIEAYFCSQTWPRFREREAARYARPRLIASYLFDHSDKDRIPELASALKDIAQWHAADHVLMLSPMAKSQIVDDLFDESGWIVSDASLLGSLWPGNMEHTSQHRMHVLGKAASSNSSLADLYQKLRRPVSWHDPKEALQVRLAIRPVRDLPHRVPRPPPLIELDPQQVEAAEPDDNLSLILGSAGSGKSLVLACRIATTAAREMYPAKYLVTAFNRDVVDQCAKWIVQTVVDGGGVLTSKQEQPGRWVINIGNTTISLWNWDLIPPRCFGQKHGTYCDRSLQEHVAVAAENARLQHAEVSRRSPELLEVSFLIDEYRLIVYGMGVGSLEAYLEIERKGRGRSTEGMRTQLGHAQRRMVWTAIEQFADFDVFTSRRRQVLRDIRRPVMADNTKFDRVFIDECQDFTHSDIEIVHYLNGNAQQVVAAGDPTQSLYLGATFKTPLPRGKGSQRAWTIYRLKHSYRLPLRVCQAIRPLSERVRAYHEGNDETFALPEPRKAATLGVRPILVVASDPDSAASQIADVFQTYTSYLPEGKREHITVADKPEIAARTGINHAELERRAKTNVTRESMRRIKGLERPFVVWDTSVHLPSKESAEEWAFTILTRTTSILVILVLRDNVSAAAQRVLPYICHAERIMPWTETAQAWLVEQATR